MGSAKRNRSRLEQEEAIDWDSFFGELASIHGQGLTIREIAQRANVSVTTARGAVVQKIREGKMRYAGRAMRASELDGFLRPIQVYAAVSKPKGRKRA